MAVYREHLEANAKINLFLEVCGRRQDGYHLLSTLMQSISISDEISVECSDCAHSDNLEPGIAITADALYIPTDARNTAYKAARAFLHALDRMNIAVKMDIRKRIPTQAGMAGGSSDAAAVLVALDRIFPNTLDKSELLSIAASIGADVPFCISGGTKLCEGIGDILTPVSSLFGLSLLLIKPPSGVSTPWAFAEYDRMLNQRACAGVSKGQRDEAMNRFLYPKPGISALQRVSDAAPFLFNDLESIVEQKYPVLGEIKGFLDRQGAIVSRMSGSGSTVYGIFTDAKTRDMALSKAEFYRNSGCYVQAAETI